MGSLSRRRGFSRREGRIFRKVNKHAQDDWLQDRQSELFSQAQAPLPFPLALLRKEKSKRPFPPPLTAINHPGESEAVEIPPQKDTRVVVRTSEIFKGFSFFKRRGSVHPFEENTSVSFLHGAADGEGATEGWRDGGAVEQGTTSC